jgi:molybdenum transport protein
LAAIRAEDSIMVTMLLYVPDEELERYLLEDAPYGDLTTQLLGIAEKQGHITFRARHRTVLSSTEEAARLLEKAGCHVGVFMPSGAVIDEGAVFLEANGSAGSLHLGWKPALNLLESACGIATRTRAMVEKARAASAEVEIVATRKIFPGTKRIATKAVLSGGAFPHRLGLSETVLIFAQHLVFLGDLEDCLTRIPEYRRSLPEKKIAVEVTSREDAVRAAKAGADIVQIDKMSEELLAELVSEIRSCGFPSIIAAAGGINEDNVAAYAATGVDVLVTSSMYWGKPADISVTIES